MSQAEELLNSLTETYSATGEEPHIVIDTDRFIHVPDELKRLGVQYDHHVETVTFDCPRYWDDHDLSEMKVYVTYMRSDGEIGSAEAKNLTVDTYDGNIMHFDWTIDGHVTEVKGQLSFLVCIRKADSEGIETNHWNSELNTEAYISQGLERTETILKQYPDVVEQMLIRAEAITSNGLLNVECQPGQLFVVKTVNSLGYPIEWEAIDQNDNMNIVSGISDGSLRSVGSAKETSTYSLGKNAVAVGSGTKASGSAAFAEGMGTEATNEDSHAEGYFTKSSGMFSHAEGAETTASGQASHAEGGYTEASASWAHAEGNGTKASAMRSHAEGSKTIASGDSAHAEGTETTASKMSSHAEGTLTVASGYQSHAEGSQTTASGNSSHAEGGATTAFGDSSHAEGSQTTAMGKYSHAEGAETIATGNASHAEGARTESIGNCSHSEGSDTIARSENSHAEGIGTIASTAAQHVQGMYNVEDKEGKYLHILGNGTSSAIRSNAHTVTKEGDAWYAGNVEGKSMIVNSSTSGSTKRFKITVDDSGSITATEV